MTDAPHAPPNRSILVQKFGGSSLTDVSLIQRVAQRIATTVREGHRVVVVVSAMGNTTNELIALARDVSPTPSRRELDMLISVGERISMALLAMALHELDVPAISLTGSQSGIITNETLAGARVVEVRPQRVRDHLERGEVVIIAGFQGVSRTREVTTLGRGGSDMTAVVLAAALEAEACEICSDVDGVWSADPRSIRAAQRLDAMTLDEGLALARAGAKVLYEEAVRYARDHGVVLHATTTFGPGSGTRLTPAADGLPQVGVASAILTPITLGDVALSARASALTSLHLAGVRVRRRIGDVVLCDVQNAHEGLPVLPEGAVVGAPVAIVSAVASGLGEDVARALRAEAALLAAEIEPQAAGACGDSAWWQVAADQHLPAARVVHQSYVEG